MSKDYPPIVKANQTHQPPPDFRQHCAGTFAANAQGKPYLNGLEAASIFLSSGLDKTVLSNIWDQASTYKNGRFTCDEFTNAMWLIEQHKTSQIPIPPPYIPYPAPPPRPYPVAVAVQPPTVTKMDMTEPMICTGCDTGFVTNNIAYVCKACPSDKNSYCEGCNRAGKRCRHVQSASRHILERGRNLKTQDKEDELGFSYKCSKCKTKFKPDELCWHCKRCFESNLCEGCWPAREKRCRHAAKGKVQLRVVGKPASIGEILDDIGEIHDLIG
ncbi:hypothetical protein VHEMI10337 [[Torrubiella] hemipterigena]|uniref:EH domain-containing protein n=1 Tax=[Torrubiella] hemipterigena TaxID=1531966 RepID=A0A0A1TT49_9HYPO|nr:hypothetical protein VHEMI10337 [[Torrubiella] hemipterigena]